jgi:hypothetical protein
MKRLGLTVAAVPLVLAAAGVGASLRLVTEPLRVPIAGVAPSYGPGTPNQVPNAAAIFRRIWVPGLDAGYDPQGLVVDAQAIYVSGYQSNRFHAHRGPCRIFRIDPVNGRATGDVDVPSPCGHAGGLALGGDGFLYVADTHTLFATPLAQAFSLGGAPFRRIPLGPGLTGGLAASTADGIGLGTYRENEPGWLYRFPAATLAGLHDGDTLAASQAATAIAIPDTAQGAAFGDDALWITRSDWNWGTLDRLDPATAAPQRRYRIAPGVEGIAFDSAGRLWAVSEAGARHYFDHPLLRWVEPFFPLVFAFDPPRLQ